MRRVAEEERRKGRDSEDGKWENLGRKCMVVLG